MIPRIWAERLLEDLRMETTWNELMREKGYDSVQLAVKPFHKRLRRALGSMIDRRREWLALKLAPWLEPEDRL